MTDLLPCPFCGGKAAIERATLGALVKCDGCRAVIPGESEAGLRAAWNRRAVPPDEALRKMVRDQLKDIVAALAPAPAVGVDGVRDPDAPCASFRRGEPRPRGECETDGHYLCDECTERASCPDCGKRPVRCECEAAPALAADPSSPSRADSRPKE